jgi:hypothetical protein
MKTKIKYILVFLAIISLVLKELILGIVFATTYTIDYADPTQYTISTPDETFVNNGKAQLSTSYTLNGTLSHGQNYLDGARKTIVDGNYAYTASYLNHAIEITNISTPATPTHVSTITYAQGYSLLGAVDLIKNGNYLYIASYTSDSINIFDVSTPASPIFVSAVTNG